MRYDTRCIYCLQEFDGDEAVREHVRSVHERPFGALVSDDGGPNIRALLAGGVPCDACYQPSDGGEGGHEATAEFYHSSGRMLCPECVVKNLSPHQATSDDRDRLLGLCEGAMDVAIPSLEGSGDCDVCRDVAEGLGRVLAKIEGAR